MAICLHGFLCRVLGTMWHLLYAARFVQVCGKLMDGGKRSHDARNKNEPDEMMESLALKKFDALRFVLEVCRQAVS